MHKRFIALFLVFLGTRNAYAQGAPEERVNGDEWLTTNAAFKSTGWEAVDTSRASFALWMNDRGYMPYEGLTGAVGLWVHQPGCPKKFDDIARKCGWNLGLTVTQWKTVVVGGNALEIDGNNVAPFGRLVNSTDGHDRYIGLVTNVFGDFSGIDISQRPSWLFGVNLTQDLYQIKRFDPGVASDKQAGGVRSLMTVDQHGNLAIAGSVAMAHAAQARAGQWAVRAPLHAGTYTFTFSQHFTVPPICIASGEGTYALRVTPKPGACIVHSANAKDSSMVDVIVVGNPD